MSAVPIRCGRRDGVADVALLRPEHLLAVADGGRILRKSGGSEGNEQEEHLNHIEHSGTGAFSITVPAGDRAN